MLSSRPLSSVARLSSRIVNSTFRALSTGAGDYDLVVIGGGPGGYVAAIKASQLGLKVLLVVFVTNQLTSYFLSRLPA